MPLGSSLGYGNIAFSGLVQLTLSPAIVNANTTSEQTFTLPGLQIGDSVTVSKPSYQAGLGIVNCRVSAKDTVAIEFMNNTGSGITPTASEVYVFEINRPSVPSGGGQLPTAFI